MLFYFGQLDLIQPYIIDGPTLILGRIQIFVSLLDLSDNRKCFNWIRSWECTNGMAATRFPRSSGSSLQFCLIIQVISEIVILLILFNSCLGCVNSSCGLKLNAAKMWCYCRTTYMPMSYLYGRKYHGPLTDLVLSIRQEIHVKPYDQIDWNKARHDCCKVGEDLVPTFHV